MTSAERREAILLLLQQSTVPVNATALADRFSVSRQVVVGDVALLRAAGADVFATPRGYVMAHHSGGLLRTVACRHGLEQMAGELETMVDEGCEVIDVIVEHPVYGQLTGQLNLSSRHDVSLLMERLNQKGTKLLSDLTGGIHLHTLRCPDEAAYERVCKRLQSLGISLEQGD